MKETFFLETGLVMGGVVYWILYIDVGVGFTNPGLGV